MLEEFILNIDVEADVKKSNFQEDEFLRSLEGLNCSPTLIKLIIDSYECDRTGFRIFIDEIRLDEDLSEDIDPLVFFLNSFLGDLISIGSKIEMINRNTISSVSWVLEDGGWETYQDIDRDYGLGSFDDLDDDW